jgi:hypothetical protein
MDRLATGFWIETQQAVTLNVAPPQKLGSGIPVWHFARNRIGLLD